MILNIQIRSRRHLLLLIGGISLIPATVLITALTVYGRDAIYRHALEKETSGRFQVRNTKVSVASDSGQVAGSETELSTPTPTKSSITDIPSNNTKSTPTPTEKPPEVKEIHTKETIEEKTIVVITATPTPSPTPTPTIATYPIPTPIPTSNSVPLSAEIECEKNGNEISVLITANQTLKWCELGVSNAGGVSIGRNRFDPNGSTCSGQFGGAYNTCYASLSSLNDEVITLNTLVH